MKAVSKVLATAAVFGIGLLSFVAAPDSVAVRAETDGGRLTFDQDGRLILPENRDRWITVGASLGLSYEGRDGNAFNVVRMDPRSYDAYVRTGQYPVGTMFELETRTPMSNVPPARGGTTQGGVIGRELHVKDEKAGRGTWTFYAYTDESGSALPIRRSEACYSCHQQDAPDDTVFSQFYPAMREAHRGANMAAEALSSSRAMDDRLARTQ